MWPYVNLTIPITMEELDAQGRKSLLILHWPRRNVPHQCRIFSPIIVFHAVKLILCHRTTEESRIHDDSSNRSFTQHMNPNMQLIKKTFFSLWTHSIIWCQFSFFPCMCRSTRNLDLSTHIWIYLINFSKLSWLLKSESMKYEEQRGN